MYFSDNDIKCFNDRTPCVGHIELDQEYNWKNVIHRLLDVKSYNEYFNSKRMLIHIGDKNKKIVPIYHKLYWELYEKLNNIIKIDGQIFANKNGAVVKNHLDPMHVIYILLQGEVTNTITGRVMKPGDWEYYPIDLEHGYIHNDGRISLSIGFYDGTEDKEKMKGKLNNENVEK